MRYAFLSLVAFATATAWAVPPPPPTVAEPTPAAQPMPVEPRTAKPAYPADPALRESTGNAEYRDGQSELFYAVPILGMEYVGVASAELHSDLLGIDTANRASFGFAYGGHLGFMFGPFRLGALYQRSELFQDGGLNFNKLFLEAGLGGRRGIVGVNLTLAGGWTFFSSRYIGLRNGGGARANLGIDFYVNRYFSLGPEVAIDGAAFMSNDAVYGAWGVTTGLRIGAHL